VVHPIRLLAPVTCTYRDLYDLLFGGVRLAVAAYF